MRYIISRSKHDFDRKLEETDLSKICSLKRPVPYPFILYIFTTRYPCENDKRRLRSHGTGRKRSGSASVHMGPFGTGPDRFQTVPCSPFLEGPEMFSHPESQSKLSNLIIRGSEENLAFRVHMRKLFETFEKGTPTTCSCAINTQLCIQSFSMLFGHLTTPFTLQMHSQLFLSPLQRPLLCCFDRKGFLAVGPGRGKNGKREGNAGNAQRSPRAWLIKFIFHREPLRRREQLCRHLL